jgi:hypothetical protein
LLGKAFATADEWSAAAGTTAAEARRMISALAVAGLLRRSAGAPALQAAVPDVIATTSGTTGLFARLRERWGR